MRTRKTFVHEDGIYEGFSRLPEPHEIHSKEVVTIDNSYDWYPEKQTTLKKESIKFEGNTEMPLGLEYKLKSQSDNLSFSEFHNPRASSALNDDFNNVAV